MKKRILTTAWVITILTLLTLFVALVVVMEWYILIYMAGVALVYFLVASGVEIRRGL